MLTGYMLRRICIIGSSSGRNAGDAALIGGIMNEIDQEVGRRLCYDIPTYRPSFIATTYPNDVRPVSMLPWHGSVGMFGLPTFASVLRSDLLLIYDNMLFDRKLYHPLFNFMPAAWTMFHLAKRAGKLLGMYNVGTGPVRTNAGRAMLRSIAELCDFITVRDEESLALLRELGVRNPQIIKTADAAIGVVPAPDERAREILRTLGLSAHTEVLGINVNTYLNSWAEGAASPLTREGFIATYAEALDEVAERLAVPILFVCTQHHDISLTEEIRGRMRHGKEARLLTNVTYNHFELKAVFRHLSLLFAMRLHANILCSSALTPTLALAFQKKVTSYYHLLGLDQYALSFADFSKERLVEHVCHGWAHRAEIRARLEEQIPLLAAQSRRSAALIARIDRGEPLTAAFEAVAGS